MNPEAPVHYSAAIGTVLKSLEAVHSVIDTFGLPASLQHLVQLRTSQMNRCGYCVILHTREARRDGESNERLDRLVVWNHVRDFTALEHAALRWTEALTRPDDGTDYGALRAELREHFSDSEIGALTATVAMTNLWNRIQISSH